MNRGVAVSDPYPIREVQPEWILQPEEMGSKKKFWYLPDEGKETRWLFKYPQEGTGQHWAEKIAAEVASTVQVEHARVELAEFEGKRGSVTESFAPKGSALHHGNQMLATVVQNYDPDATFNQSSHTLTNILKVMDMDNVFGKPEEAKLRIADYMVLDALIGNTDRHHENWGILRTRVDDQWENKVAPSFDHASSLGRELQDVRREKFLVENRVGDYAEKGRGAIYWSEDEEHGPSPLALLRRAAQSRPALFRPALVKLERINESSMGDLVSRVPVCWMTRVAREFTIALMTYNHEQLGKL